MEKEKISPQVKILKALIELKGERSSKEVSEYSGVNLHSTCRSIDHLKNRFLVKKKVKPGTYSDGRTSRLIYIQIPPGSYAKALRLVNQAYGETINEESDNNSEESNVAE